MKNPCNRSDSSKLCFSNNPCPKPGGSGSPTLVLLFRPHCNPSADGFHAAKVPAKRDKRDKRGKRDKREQGCGWGKVWGKEGEKEKSATGRFFGGNQQCNSYTKKKRHVQLAGVKEQVKQMAASGSHNTPLLSSPPCR